MASETITYNNKKVIKKQIQTERLVIFYEAFT